MAIETGTRLGRYEIRSQLGAGGMGEVYLAEDTQLGRRVAIKFLSPELVADERANKRLVKEAPRRQHLTIRTSALSMKSAKQTAAASSPCSTWRARRSTRESRANRWS